MLATALQVLRLRYYLLTLAMRLIWLCTRDIWRMVRPLDRADNLRSLSIEALQSLPFTLVYKGIIHSLFRMKYSQFTATVLLAVLHLVLQQAMAASIADESFLELVLVFHDVPIRQQLRFGCIVHLDSCKQGALSSILSATRQRNLCKRLRDQETRLRDILLQDVRLLPNNSKTHGWPSLRLSSLVKGHPRRSFSAPPPNQHTNLK